MYTNSCAMLVSRVDKIATRASAVIQQGASRTLYQAAMDELTLALKASTPELRKHHEDNASYLQRSAASFAYIAETYLNVLLTYR